jgi:hypothetical protein
MFENKVDIIQTYDEVTYSHHLPWSMPNYPHIISLYYGLGALVLVTILIFLRDLFNKKDKGFNILPNYFKALKISDCEAILEDEDHFRQHGGFSYLSN